MHLYELQDKISLDKDLYTESLQMVERVGDYCKELKDKSKDGILKEDEKTELIMKLSDIFWSVVVLSTILNTNMEVVGMITKRKNK
jgi:hypothetical protein